MSPFAYSPYHRYEPRWKYRTGALTYVIAGLAVLALIAAATVITGYVGG